LPEFSVIPATQIITVKLWANTHNAVNDRLFAVFIAYMLYYRFLNILMANAEVVVIAIATSYKVSHNAHPLRFWTEGLECLSNQILWVLLCFKWFSNSPYYAHPIYWVLCALRILGFTHTRTR